MPRQPLTKLLGKSKSFTSWAWALPATWAHPELIGIIGECLMLWPEAELEAALLLANLMKAETDATISVYSKLRRSVSRREALKAAAEVSLDERDLQLFEAVLSVYSRVEADRNDLAHGCFGTSFDIPDGLLWIEQQHFARILTKNKTMTLWDGESTQRIRPYSEFEPYIFVYKQNDLAYIRKDIEELIMTMKMFNGYLSWDLSEKPSSVYLREELYFQLCLEPRIREVLARRPNVREEPKPPSAPPRKSKPSRLVLVSNPPLTRRKARRS